MPVRDVGSLALVMPGVPKFSMFVSSLSPFLARLVRAAVSADARIAGLVRVVVFVVPALAGAFRDDVLIALVRRTRGPERRLEAGLRRCVRAGQRVERN